MRVLALILALLLPVRALAAPPLPVADAAVEEESPPPVEATLVAGSDGASRMTVPVMINGQGPFYFVIDTGADRTVIARETAERLGLPRAGKVTLHAMGGSADVSLVKVERLDIAARTMSRRKLAALPRAYVGADGLLGLDSLKGQRIVMDFKAGTMKLETAATPEAPAPAGTDLIVVTARTRLGQLVLADADANGQKVWVVVDTGAQNSIGNTSLRRLMLSRNPKTEVKPIEMIDVLGRRFGADYTIVNRLRIGGILMGNAAIAFTDAHPFKLFDLHKLPSLLLGMESLRSFERVSVDFATKKVKFLIPASAAPPSDRMAVTQGKPSPAPAAP